MRRYSSSPTNSLRAAASKNGSPSPDHSQPQFVSVAFGESRSGGPIIVNLTVSVIELTLTDKDLTLSRNLFIPICEPSGSLFFFFYFFGDKTITIARVTKPAIAVVSLPAASFT